jgi:hypothetical protein
MQRYEALRRILVVTSLLFLLVLPGKTQEKIYIGAHGLLTSAQNIGYNEDALGGALDILVIKNRVGLYSNATYSTSKKVKTKKGYSLGAKLEGMVRIREKFYVTSGIRWRYYTAGLWEKQANMIYIGVRFGLPDDKFSIAIDHSFQEHQTDTECIMSTIKFSSMIIKGKTIGLQIQSRTRILRYNLGVERKTGISGDIGVGIYLKFR